MPPANLSAESFIKQAESRMKLHQYKDALAELQSMFNKRVTFEWNSALERFVKLHAQLSVKLRMDRSVQDALTKFRIKFLELHNLEKLVQVVDCYLKEAESMLESAKVSATAAAERRLLNNIDEAVREITGASLERTTEDRALEDAFTLYHTIVQKCVRALSQDGMLEASYQQCVSRVFKTYKEAGRIREFMGLSKLLRTHTEILTAVSTEPKPVEQKLMILNDKYYANNVERMMETRHTQILAAAALGDWDNVYNCIVEQRQVTIALAQAQKAVPVKSQLEFHADLKYICHLSKLYAFGAHVAIAFANLSKRDTTSGSDATLAATQAVLAVLCVAPSNRRASVSIAHDQLKEKQLQMCRALGIPTPPTRNSLIADLQRSGLIDDAHPLARELFARLNDPHSVAFCQHAAPLLNELASVSDTFHRYLPTIREVAVRTLMGVIASCFSQVSIPHFIALTGFFSEKEFAKQLEPLIVSVAADASSAVSVAIDDASHSIRFSSTASCASRAVGVESEFSQRLSAAVHSCFAAPSRTAPKTNATQLLSRIEEERLRIYMRSRICDQRIEKQHEREKFAKDREEQRKQEDLRRRQAREAERNEKRREHELRQVAKQVTAQEAVERRKWVVKHIMAKHKGFVVGLELANLSAEDFAETLTAKLLEFRRKEEMTKESDARSMDYFERACREEEIPRREAYEQNLAESNARKAEERRENRRRQHREDWEKAIEAKDRLRKFENQRYKYEEDLGAALKEIKLHNKHDAQNAALQAAIAEREAMAAAAARETQDTSPPPASSAPPAASKSAWVPKSKR